MNKYRKIVEEIQEGSAQNALRRQLLGPRPLDPHSEVVSKLPRRKRFVGPAPWYEVLKESKK